MKRIRITGDSQLVECKHCQGLGLCNQATLKSEGNYCWNECPICGPGDKKENCDTTSALSNPVCSLCEGKGHLIIEKD